MPRARSMNTPLQSSVPQLPKMRDLLSPHLVRIYDEIRVSLDDEEHAEFYWFAREYPRCYRYHLDAADFRLCSIHALMTRVHTDLLDRISDDDSATFEVAQSDHRVQQIYWDFESFLSHISIALDLLTRSLTPAFKIHVAPSFNRFCKRAPPDSAFSGLLIRARDRWVTRLKDYRDCFTHYTPVDTILSVALRQYADGWEVRAKLPVNPNVRDIDSFRYSRRVELLRYAVTVHRQMTSLDKAVAKQLWCQFRSGQFPDRISGLFAVGQRQRE